MPISFLFIGIIAIHIATRFPRVSSAGWKQPNFIVIQPDDNYFFQEWNPPGQFDGSSSLKNFPPNSNGLPNINRIRENGIEMKSAYAASTMCGTSRYSTITGRYPSRSSYGRALDEYSELRDVRIPATKLEDVAGVWDGKDCSANNIAALLQRNGYRTGVVGKWHLTSDDGGQYSYGKIQDDIKDCGFDFAEAIYKENLWGDWYGDVTHNMEHVTSKAIEFIESAVAGEEEQPFFLYFNPTVPHSSADVTDALRYADCRVTLEGTLSQPPVIPYGMTADFGGDCGAYRQSVLNRGGLYDDKLAGAVWLDDAIGSLIQTLENSNVLDNTFLLFQLDHGEAMKGTLFEPGSRIVQFIHYPDRIAPGSSFEGLVSTIDVAATIVEVAGISGYVYPMDGKSWMSEAINGFNAWSGGSNNRCLFVEEGNDRSVRCGCYKYISIDDAQDGRTVSGAARVRISVDNNNFYNLCDEDTGAYIKAPERSPERRSAGFDDSLKDELKEKVRCHVRRTDPSNYPDYETKECDKPLVLLPDDTESPTEALITGFPTKRPTTAQPTVGSSELISIASASSDDLDQNFPTKAPTTQFLPPPSLHGDFLWTLPNNKFPTNAPATTQSSPPIWKPTNLWFNLNDPPPALITTVISSPSKGPTNSPTTNSPTNNSTPRPSSSITIWTTVWATTAQPSRRPTPLLRPTPRPTTNESLPQTAFITDAPTESNSDSYDVDDDSSSNFINTIAVVAEKDLDDCFDEEEYLYYDVDGQNCHWVVSNDRCDREDPNTNLHVGKHHCPQSCSFCSSDNAGCVDNPYYLWYGQEGNDCSWIEENGRCDRIRSSFDGTMLRVGEHFCPESCGSCSTSGVDTQK